MVSGACRGAWSQTDPDLITIERSESFMDRSSEKVFVLISLVNQNLGTERTIFESERHARKFCMTADLTSHVEVSCLRAFIVIPESISINILMNSLANGRATCVIHSPGIPDQNSCP
jgi:hypothetical protein